MSLARIFRSTLPILAVAACTWPGSDDHDAPSSGDQAVVDTPPPAAGVSANPAVTAYRQAHSYEIVKELMDFVANPNVATDIAAIKQNAEFLKQMLVKRGLEPKILTPNGNDNVPPSVFAEIRTPGATRTLMLYAHYDGVAVTPANWKVTQPFQPIVMAKNATGLTKVPFDQPVANIDPEWRLYGRSTADDKGAVVAILTALDALRASPAALTSNIKLFFEGEEEQSSPNIQGILTDNKDLLASDMWVIFDSPSAITGQKQAYFGVRGIKLMDVTVYGPNAPLHSGHFGNWAPNPAAKLSHLVSSMVDMNGRVTIDGYYDDVEPLGQLELAAIKETASSDPLIAKQFGIAKPDGDGQSLAALLAEPSLNIRGFTSGDTPATSVVPSSATVALDVRVVKGNDFERQPRKIIDHIKRQGYYVFEVGDSNDREPTADERAANPLIAKIHIHGGGYNAERLNMDNALARQVIAAAQTTTPDHIRQLPTMGASLPAKIITDVLQTPQIMLAWNNYDNNQHAADENLRIQNLWDGIDMAAAIATMPK
jgi:acetylornithine deacetylase/succinyl-diaminopimelate desuccinylase-like protein